MEPYESIVWMWEDMKSHNPAYVEGKIETLHARMFFMSGALASYVMLMNLMRKAQNGDESALTLMNVRDEIVRELDDAKNDFKNFDSTRIEG